MVINSKIAHNRPLPFTRAIFAITDNLSLDKTQKYGL